MRLDLTDDQQFFLDTLRRFVAGETPIDVVRTRIGAPEAFDRAWWRQAAELGAASLLVPEELGGGSVSGRGPVDLVMVAEEFGRGAVPSPLVPVNVVAETIARSGSDTQRQLLPEVVAGSVVAAWATDDVGSLSLTPAADGFTLGGAAPAVEAADQADHLLVTAASPEGPTQVLLPADTTGITIEPRESLDLLKRFSLVRFDGVAVPASAVVGGVGSAAADVARQRQITNLLQCAEMCGAAARVLEFTIEYAFDRVSFGRPLASYQALKHRFADMKLWLEASFAITDAAAAALSDGDDPEMTESWRLVHAAKSYVGDRSVELIQDCVQLHGGIGVTWEHDIHLYLRRATVDRGLFGGPADHRAELADLVGI
jgi:alkylation response protein AidB-like acyl-CoA dehydrogenase